MQVVHQNTHVTHAVIGGQKVIEMQTSSSAEFIHIMASSIYKDQKLAVVREVICNAWDAHIEAGITNRPIEITLTHEKLIIRDFGNGIHHDDMGPVYGVFGNSTKKNDGKQTGGFGLGCKAPYAYVDHFEVISMHDGIKTIYNLSKSSAEAQGKPAIVPIVSIPSKETGLQVSIDIKSGDYERFEQLIQRICRNGDMNALFNGKPVSSLNLSTFNGSYLITAYTDLFDRMPSIMLRYGNVIYPVEYSSDISWEYNRVKAHLDKLRLGHTTYSIVLQAPPHSIAVQPSREGLSMQPHTIATVKKLMTDFLQTLDTQFINECEKIAKTTVDKAVAEVRVADLIDTSDKLPFKVDVFAPDRIEDLTIMAQRYMQSNYPASLEFRKRDLSYRVKAMAEGGLINRGMAQSYIRAIRKVKTSHYRNREYNDWLQRRIIGKLATKMAGTSLSLDRLYVYDPNDQNAPRSAYSRTMTPLVLARKAQPKHHFMTLPYLRNIVVLATSKANVFERAGRDQTFIDLGRTSGFLFYHVPMKKAEKEAAIAFFKATDMEVVDLTERQPWEVSAPSAKSNAAPAPRKPKKEGFPRLSGIISTKTSINIPFLLNDDIERIAKPEFAVLASTANGSSRHTLTSFSESASRAIVDLFGDKGAITNNSTVYTKMCVAGASLFEDYVRSKVCVFMVTNPHIAEYWAYNPDRAMSKVSTSLYFPKDLLKVIYKSSILRAKYGLVNNLTAEEYKYLIIWKDLYKTWSRHQTTDDVRFVSKYLEDIPVHQTNLDLIQKIKNSKVLPLVDSYQLAEMVRINPEDSPEAQTAIKILDLALS